ncbi:polysaccharide pyruvyl transferase family protein [Lutibacter sp. TH_r2]|uniref:polysaccharide pyruvyl transferase family protein n=1 Tax=Lutibacter sp. TH_r2 TaxID=3082083 RepID=UPI0029531558|nr:polysaccharide pyruvyl transferase family protein [Lutibacter sp. TH_r2]MDV7187799.1 polysaccharide pyruvyl transferase family protein [Lutibacter sp. TH_r2]
MSKLKTKLKIGILTLPLKGNYGGVLQAFALLTYLKNEGYNAYLVDRQWDRSKKTIGFYVQKFIYHEIIRGKVKKFCDKWINPKTFSIDSQEKMQQLNKEDFDAFIVGSDQVWRVENVGGVKNNYFLDFISDKKVKKIAYAASFGKDTVDGSDEKILKISKLLKDFNAISVREDTGVNICHDVFKVEASHVLDPVFLINKKEYLKTIDKNLKPLENTLITYVLDYNKKNEIIINDIAKKLNLKIQSINYKKDPALLIKNKALDFYNYRYPSVSNWLRGFRDADFIVTDSFHGTMFSVIFGKQFIVIGNEKRGLTRFTSFLKSVGLLNRLVLPSQGVDMDTVFEKIDYEKVNKILKIEKIKSKSFLETSILG